MLLCYLGNLVAPVPPKIIIKKKLNSDQNCSVQVYFFIGVFGDVLRSKNFVKTLNAFISKLHFENGSLVFSGTTFVQIYRAYVKKYFLVSQSFVEKKICSFIYKKLMKNGIKIFKKISNTCHLSKKTPPHSLLWLF